MLELWCKSEYEKCALVSSNDKFGTKCGKHGEPWLTNDWNERSACEQFVEHRQVGSASVTYNHDSSILLIPLEVSWDLANNEECFPYLGKGWDRDTMVEKYEQLKEIIPDSSVDNILANTMFEKENGEYDTELFFTYLHEYDQMEAMSH